MLLSKYRTVCEDMSIFCLLPSCAIKTHCPSVPSICLPHFSRVIGSLQAMEETLETLQSMKGRSLESLQEELAESREIASQMKLNARSQVLQLLISVMLNCDNDGDLILSDAEIDSLIENTEAINGVQVNEDLLRDEIIKHGRSLVAVMEVTRNLIMSGQKRCEDKGTPPSNQSIFRFLESSEESEH